MVGLWLAARVATAAPAPLLPDLNARLHSGDSTPWTILFVLTLITLLPAILMAMTPMVRLLVVFHFLRQALGTQTAPSNPTLMGLALMMTWFLMTPVLNQVDQQAVVRRLADSLRQLIGTSSAAALPVLLCPSPARYHVKRWLEPVWPRLAVIAAGEIPPEIRLRPVGTVR